MRLTGRILLLLLVMSGVACCETLPDIDLAGAKWIWHAQARTGTALFRKTVQYTQPVDGMDILISADDSYELRVNGRVIGSGSDWRTPQFYQVARPIARESSAITVKCANADGEGGMVCKVVVHLRDGSSETIVSDSSWQCSTTEVLDWDTTHADPAVASWPTAREVGAYPCAPWGQIVREKWESLQGRLIERREAMQRAAEKSPAVTPVFSEFKGKYVRPEYAAMYKSFVKLDAKTGLLRANGAVIRPFFTIYNQPGPDGSPILTIPDFDFDLVEKDFARMKQAGIDVYPRFWNWSELLNADGSWQEVKGQPKGRGLPYFRYNYQIYDYFLDRAQAHGLYVNIEPSYYWGLHPDVVPSQYRDRVLLYDELWDAAREAYSRILNYYSKRTVIVAAMVGEEDLEFGHCLDEPEMLDRFRGFLRKRYGAVTNLQRTWTSGYDFTDRSLWQERELDGKKVLWPQYRFSKGTFDSWKSFDDVKLPIFDHYRSADNPSAPLNDKPTYGENILRDPVWIDFMEMKQQILISRLNDLADSLHRADPNHIMFYCNPYDNNPAWHFMHCFDRARLRWDVIGVGQHDNGFEPSEVEKWATCREYVQNVASYGPYLTAPGAYARGFACGEGMGGKSREGIGRYYPWWLTDIIGGGGAFFQSYDWGFISGRTKENPTAYDDSTLNQFGSFLGAVRNAQFSFKRDAEVLILRNERAAFGMSAGYDFGNARALASILYQTHIPFDILPDTDVTLGGFEEGKVNLARYRFIFVPAQNQLLDTRTWQLLQDWVTDPRFAGKRGLCFGLYQDQDSYFNETQSAKLHPAFESLVGTRGYTRRIPVTGVQQIVYRKPFGSSGRGDEIALEFPSGAEIGCFESAGTRLESIMALGSESGPSVVARNTVNGNAVYSCGFYLGMAYNPVWGMEKYQTPYNALTPLYRAMLASTDIQAAITAPDNLGVFISDDGSTVLVKERYGIPTDVTMTIAGWNGSVYGGTTVGMSSDGVAQVTAPRIDGYGTMALRRAAKVSIKGGTALSWACKSSADGSLDLTVNGRGRASVGLTLRPRTSYTVRGESLSMTLATDQSGSCRFPLDLTGKHPLHVVLKSVRR